MMLISNSFGDVQAEAKQLRQHYRDILIPCLNRFKAGLNAKKIEIMLENINIKLSGKKLQYPLN
jgi:hypothetical protein